MLKQIPVLFLTLIICGLLLGPNVTGGNPRTGEVDDNKYTDTRFGFSVQFPDDWKVGKPKKEYTEQRVIAEKKNPRVPVRLRSEPDWAVKPTMMIFADSTDMPVDQFFAFLQADSGKSELKEKILMKSVLLHRLGPYRPDVLATTSQEVAGAQAVKRTCRLQYDAQVRLPGSDRREMVRSFRIGHIYLVPFDGWLMYIEQVCENDFFPTLDETFAEITASLGFGEEQEKPEKKEAEEKKQPQEEKAKDD